MRSEDTKRERQVKRREKERKEKKEVVPGQPSGIILNSEQWYAMPWDVSFAPW